MGAVCLLQAVYVRTIGCRTPATVIIFHEVPTLYCAPNQKHKTHGKDCCV